MIARKLNKTCEHVNSAQQTTDSLKFISLALAVTASLLALSSAPMLPRFEGD